jgi:uncharacterized protein (TIGR02246 family)
MGIRQFTSAVFAAASLLSCARPPAPPPGPSPAVVRAAIDSQFAKLSAAYRDRDGTAFAAIYMADGVSSSPQGTLTGRPAIEAMMKKAFADVVSTTGDTVVTEDFVVANDRAVQSGHITWTETDKGRQPVQRRVDFVFNWRTDADGVWRIQRDLDYQATK